MKNGLLALAAFLLLTACSNERTKPLAEPIAFFATHDQAGGDTTEIRLDGDEPFHIRSIADLTLTNIVTIDYGDTMRGIHSATSAVVWVSNRVVTIQMTDDDAFRFAALTRRLEQRRLAIRWGEDVIGAPVIRLPIERGNLQFDVVSNNALIVEVHMTRQGASGAHP